MSFLYCQRSNKSYSYYNSSSSEICPAYLIKDIKEASHALITRERSIFQNFPGWQVGYSGFTYHISSKEYLISYVKNQAEHHKTITFKDELIRLLKENEVDFKDEYLFI